MTREELIEAIVLNLIEAPGDYAKEKKAITRSKRIARLKAHNPDPGEAHAYLNLVQGTLDKVGYKAKYLRKAKHRGHQYPL